VTAATFASHRVRADLLRKVSGSTEIGKTMRKAVKALASRNIRSLIVDGYAVQENGSARFTSDVDIVVPDVAEAYEVLSINGFRETAGSSMTLTDRVTKVKVDLLPGGGSVEPGPLKLPLPTTVNDTPTIADLKTLIEINLSSYIGSPTRRAQDLTDVVQLVQSNGLDREFGVDPAVRGQCLAILDGLAADNYAMCFLGLRDSFEGWCPVPRISKARCGAQGNFHEVSHAFGATV
jgi:hypothetical protein